MNRIGDEVASERMHLHERRHSSRVAEVVAVLALGQAWVRCGLDAANDWVHVALERRGRSADTSIVPVEKAQFHGFAIYRPTKVQAGEMALVDVHDHISMSSELK